MMLKKMKKTQNVLSILLAFLLVIPSGIEVFAADDVFDRYKHYESAVNNGRGTSDSTSGATLTWNESRFMDSYMDVYETYGDTYWLDKMVDHFDRVKDEATDLEGNGYYTWDSNNYTLHLMSNPGFEEDGQDASAPELVTNGGFEEPVAGYPLTPRFWTRESGDGTVVYRTTTSGEYYSGTAGLVVKYNSGNEAVLKQNIDYAPGKEYSVSFAAKTGTRHMAGKIEIYDETQSKVIGESKTFGNESIFVDEWMKLSFNFVAPTTAGNTLSVRMKLLDYDQSGWIVYYDDVSIKPTVTNLDTVENGGFWREDASDSTLPDAWSRTGTNASSSNVYRTETAGEYVSASSGAVIESDGLYWKNLEQEIPYKPGEKYLVSFYGKTNASTAYGKVKIIDNSGTIEYLEFNNTDWEKHRFIFEAPAQEGEQLTIQLRQKNYNDASWIVYYDDVEVEPYQDNIVDGYSFEAVQSGDSTMADGWERYQSNSSQTYLSTALDEYNAGNKGMVVESNNIQIPMVRQKLYLIPGVKYQVSFSKRNNVPESQGRVEIYNATDSQVLGSHTSSNLDWSGGSFEFTAPDQASDVVYLRLKHQSTTSDNWITYFDNVKVNPVMQRGFKSWERVNGDATTIYATNELSSSYSGSYGLVVGNDGSGTDGYVEQQLMAYEPGRKNSVSYRAKTSDASRSGKVVVYDETTSQVIAQEEFTNTSWSGKSLDFTAPAQSGHVIKIQLKQTNHTDSSAYAYFDEVNVSQRKGLLLDDAMISKPVLRFIKAVYDDPDLHTAYKTKADSYLDFIENDVFPQWDSYYTDIGNGEGAYVNKDGNDGNWFPGRSLPHNHNLVVAECYVYLWKITNNSSYLTRATSLYNGFKSMLTTNTAASTAYQWNYWDGFGSWDDGFWYNSPVEDISHGTIDVSSLLTAYHYGVVFTASDMEKVASAFVDAMWNGSTSQPLLGKRLNIQGETTEDLHTWSQAIWDWVRLAEIDPQIWDIANTIVENHGGSNARLLRIMAKLVKMNPEVLVNSGFEWSDPSDSTLPALWERRLSTSSTAYRDTSNKNDGAAGATSITNGSTWNILEQQLKNYVPNSDYTLEFDSKASDPSTVRARGQVYNYTTTSTMTEQYVGTSAWSSFTRSFTTPTSGTDDIWVRLYHDATSPAGEEAYFDNVKILPSLWNSFVPNGGFEQSEKLDSTLPRYWERENGTVSSNAVLTTSDKYKGNSSLKLDTEPSSGDQQLVYRLYGYKPGVTYKLTFYSKTNGSNAKAKAYVVNQTGSSTLASQVVDNTSWQNYEVTFTAPNDYEDVVKIYLGHNDSSISGGTAYFDELGVLLQ